MDSVRRASRPTARGSPRAPARRACTAAAYALAGASLAGCTSVLSTAQQLARLMATADSVELREERPSRRSTDARARLLLIALDGMNRELLYHMLRAGELPGLSALLGGRREGRFPHAYLAPDLTTTFPSSSAPAWVTLFTGHPPARHGVVGNEYFVRRERQLHAPVPITTGDPGTVIAAYTEGYWNELAQVPGVYEQMRRIEPDVRIWVSMHPYHAGASKLIVSESTVLLDALEAFVAAAAAELPIIGDDDTSALSQKVDEAAIEATVKQLAAHPAPHVLTLYIAGIDHVAHTARKGPDEARRRYLSEHLDPLLARFHRRLAARGLLDDAYVVITSDHGHIEVRNEDGNALGVGGDDEPDALLRKAGLRLRPFRLTVDEGNDFDAVLAYQGATAFVYLADRSTCPEAGTVCDWKRPARFAEDVVPVAEAIWANNRSGHLVPELKGALELILTRRASATPGSRVPFDVYLGNGRTIGLQGYLDSTPVDHVHLLERMIDLTTGPYGDRAGDLILIARSSARLPLEQRYYFGSQYYSWHGGPTAGDSNVPLIVAHRKLDAAGIEHCVRSVLGPHPRPQRIADLLLELRYRTGSQPDATSTLGAATGSPRQGLKARSACS